MIPLTAQAQVVIPSDTQAQAVISDSTGSGGDSSDRLKVVIPLHSQGPGTYSGVIPLTAQVYRASHAHSKITGSVQDAQAEGNS